MLRSFGRTALKTLSWRTFATVDTFLIGWCVTGSLSFAGAIIGVEILTKSLWYAVHEQAWTYFTGRISRHRRDSDGDACTR